MRMGRILRVRRPIVVTGKRVTLGFSDATRQELEQELTSRAAR